jgi:hypothetical protein
MKQKIIEILDKHWSNMSNEFIAIEIMKASPRKRYPDKDGYMEDDLLIMLDNGELNKWEYDKRYPDPDYHPYQIMWYIPVSEMLGDKNDN